MGGQRGEELARGGRPAELYPNFLTSELGIMEETLKAPLRGGRWREVG